MSTREAFTSILHLFVLFIFFSIGLFFVSAFYVQDIRLHIFDLFANNRDLCLWMGLGFFFISFLLFLGFFAMSRGKYLRFQMGTSKGPIDVDKKLVQESIEECFKIHFPQKVNLETVEISSDSRIELAVTLNAPLEKQFLKGLEKELQFLLLTQFGYKQPFYLRVYTHRVMNS